MTEFTRRYPKSLLWIGTMATVSAALEVLRATKVIG